MLGLQLRVFVGGEEQHLCMLARDHVCSRCAARFKQCELAKDLSRPLGGDSLACTWVLRVRDQAGALTTKHNEQANACRPHGDQLLPWLTLDRFERPGSSSDELDISISEERCVRGQESAEGVVRGGFMLAQLLLKLGEREHELLHSSRGKRAQLACCPRPDRSRRLGARMQSCSLSEAVALPVNFDQLRARTLRDVLRDV
mmetsp:Transcript_54667/g.150529  ORF Transcript_54667/g.150529 Transcript_54667/m.150529 type:complete len:201 (-) Transcript_54667:3632-4234(-)